MDEYNIFDLNATHLWYENSSRSNYPEFFWKSSMNLLTVLTLIFIALGIIGNLLCIITFAKREMRSLTIHLIFLLLAIVNTLSLFIFLLKTIGMNRWYSSNELCIFISVFTEALQGVDNLLVALASVVYISCHSCHCCSNHQTNRCSLNSKIWYCQPWVLVFFSFLVIIVTFGSFNGAHICQISAKYILSLFRPFIMSIIFIVLSCIYMYRIIRYVSLTQITPTSVMLAEEVEDNKNEQSGNTSLYDIPLFLLHVFFIFCHLSTLVDSVKFYVSDHFPFKPSGIVFSNLFNLFYLLYFCGKIFIYATTLHSFRHNLLTLCKMPGHQHQGHNKTIGMTEA